MGFDLNKAVKHRAKLSKGSQEYNVVQNQINAAMGVKKKRAVAGVKRDKDVKLADAKKSVEKKAKRTLAQVGKAATHAKKKSPAIKKALAGVKKPKAKKKKTTRRYASGM
jgi:hypothetical protein